MILWVIDEFMRSARSWSDVDGWWWMKVAARTFSLYLRLLSLFRKLSAMRRNSINQLLLNKKTSRARKLFHKWLHSDDAPFAGSSRGWFMELSGSLLFDFRSAFRLVFSVPRKISVSFYVISTCFAFWCRYSSQKPFKPTEPSPFDGISMVLQ